MRGPWRARAARLAAAVVLALVAASALVLSGRELGGGDVGRVLGLVVVVVVIVWAWEGRGPAGR